MKAGSSMPEGPGHRVAARRRRPRDLASFRRNVSYLLRERYSWPVRERARAYFPS
jgi:hypothetical protein